MTSEDTNALVDTKPGGRSRAAAVVLVLLAVLYAVGMTVVLPLIGSLIRGWILNPDGHAWWRLTSLYAVLDFFWMQVGVLLTLTCAVALATRRRWASSVAVCVAAVGIASRSVATGGHLLLWILWDRSSISTYMRLELALTGAMLFTGCSIIYLLRGGHARL